MAMVIGEPCWGAGDAAIEVDGMAVLRRRLRRRRAIEVGKMVMHADVAFAFSVGLAVGVTERHGCCWWALMGVDGRECNDDDDGEVNVEMEATS